MEFLKVSLIILITVVFVTTLPVIDKPVASLVTICACAMIMFLVTDKISEVITDLYGIFGDGHTGNFSVLFKIMGISIITQFVSDIALDCGNKTLSNQMIFIGKASILILGLPVFMEVLEIIGSLLK